MSADAAALFPAGEPLRLEAPEDIAGLVPRSAVVRERLGRCYEIEIVLESFEPPIAAQQLLGRPLALLLNLDGTNARCFHGLVSELRRLGEIEGREQYRATLRPWLWFLTKTRNCRSFQNKSVPEIIELVFREHEFADFEPGPLSGSYPPREFVVQYQESDLAFVSRLMEDCGLHFHFRHARDRHTLLLCDAGAEHGPVPEYESLQFRPPTTSLDEHLEYVEHWAAVHRVEANGYAAQHFDFERPNSLLTASGSRGGAAPGPIEIYDFPAVIDQARQADALAELAQYREQCRAERFEGRSNCRGLSCGHSFELREHPWAEHNRTFLVVASVTHLAGQELVSTSRAPSRGRQRLVVSCEFEAQAASQPYVLPRSTPRPCIPGAQTAVVSGPAQQELWTDPQGRVQLRFHWDRRRSGAEPASCWVRVSQLWAGAGFGAVHLPRVGDEVIVQFLDGDPDRPIVVGRVYNGTHEHPYDPGRTPNLSGIRSASIGGTLGNYNEIRFDDRKGAEQFHLQAERDHTQLVKHARSIEIGADDRLQVGGDRSLTVQGGLRMCVGEKARAAPGAAGTVVLAAETSIELRCGKSVLRLTPDQVELSCGGSSITLKPESIELWSGGFASVTLTNQAVVESPEDVTLTGQTIKLNSR